MTRRPDAGASGASRDLLAWFDQRERDIPWRGETDPYRILLAEVMAQQTRIETVRPYYERFTRRFPDIESLAAADPDEVLKLWEGLGYYRRARHLQAAARVLVASHGGRVPDTAEELRELPGVGPYTAGAVVSIAFGRSEPAIDGNARRVLSRLFDLESARPATLETSARELLAASGGRAGALNQALMDLGSHVCVPRTPRCAECPLASDCLARSRGTVELRPGRTERAPTPERHAVAAIIRRDDRVLVVQRPEGGLLGGLWDFPSVPIEGGASDQDASGLLGSLRDGIASDLGVRIDVGPRIAVIRHAFSHFRLRLFVHEALWRGGRLDGRPKGRWVAPAELEALALPAYCRTLVPRLAGVT